MGPDLQWKSNIDKGMGIRIWIMFNRSQEGLRANCYLKYSLNGYLVKCRNNLCMHVRNV
jgi:hypothetical protein